MRSTSSSPVLSPADLLTELGHVVLLDARTGSDAASSFATAHLPGARFVDLERDLAAPGDPREGGRHPLPSVADFAVTLGRLGIEPTDSIVVYDLAAGANAAARLWWMLRAAGHRDVRVLDAKPETFGPAGLAMTSEPTSFEPKAPYPLTGWQLPIATRERVESAMQDPTTVVLDVRAPARYRGETEPIDPIAGHIPGAKNLFHLDLVDEHGRLLPPDAIVERTTRVLGTTARDHVVVHCGSGVTACHALLAFEHAGLGISPLYVGSWSEWCRRPELPRATGAEA